MYAHLTDLEFADNPSHQYGPQAAFLIGNDYYWLRRGESRSVPMESSPVPKDESFNVSRDFVLSHTLHVNTSQGMDNITVSGSDYSLVDQVKQFCELESIGILPSEWTVHDKFLQNIHQVEGRYEVCLPWKEHHRLLPDNYNVAVNRLN